MRSIAAVVNPFVRWFPLAALLIGGCVFDGACRRQSDCSSSESCVPPGIARGCGIPCAPQRDCEGASDCDSGRVCAEYVATCCFAGELSSRCVAPCTMTGCSEGERCDDGTGLCGAVRCDDGFACAAHTVCAPSDPTADAHGCARSTCAGDGDCGGGACVDALCYEGPGSCEPPVP